MLFKTKPADIDQLQFMEMKSFPFKKYLYMMWCGKIIYRKDNKDKVMDHMLSSSGQQDMNHETIHLRQAQQAGSWFRYYLKYFWEWIRSGYYTSCYEMEAYAYEDVDNYCQNYTGDNLKRFKNMKNKTRRFYYKYAGNNSYDWKVFLKSNMF